MSASSSTNPSMVRTLQNRSRPDAFVLHVTRFHVRPDCAHRHRFPKHQILIEESCVRVSFSSLFPVSLPLLLRVPGLIVQYNSESPLDKAKSFLSLTVAGHEYVVDTAQCTRSAFLRHRVSSPISVRVSRDVFLLLAQIVGFRRRDCQVEIQVSWSFQISQRLLLGACQI